MTRSQALKGFAAAAALLTAVPALAQNSNANNNENYNNPTATSGSQSAAASNATGGAANLNATIAPVQQSSNANSLRDDSVTNNTNTANGGTGGQAASAASANGNNNGSSQNTNINKTPRWGFNVGVGVFTSPGELFGLDRPVQVMCDPETNKVVMVTHRSGVISGTATHIRAPKKDKGYMKAFKKNTKTDPTSAYLDCPVETKPEAPQANFTAPVIVPVPMPAPKETPVIVESFKVPAPTYKKVRRAVTFHKPVAVAKPVAAAKPCVTTCPAALGQIQALNQRVTALEAKRPAPATKAAPALRK